MTFEDFKGCLILLSNDTVRPEHVWIQITIRLLGHIFIKHKSYE